MSSPRPHLEDGELPCRHRNGQQVHAEMPQYVCSRPGMLAVQPRSENSRDFIREVILKKPKCAGANIKVIHAGYDYGHNTHASMAHTYKIESKTTVPSRYAGYHGNKATSYGFIAAAEGWRALFSASIPLLRQPMYCTNSPSTSLWA